MPEHIENAQIKETFFGVEGHGILTFYLTCEGENGTQSFGGFQLDYHPSGGERTVTFPDALLLMRDIIEAVGADSWERLAGHYCRVRRDERHVIVALGHLTRNKWADATKYLDRLKEKA